MKESWYDKELLKLQRSASWLSLNKYNTFMFHTVLYDKKYHKFWGLSEANNITCNYPAYNLNNGGKDHLLRTLLSPLFKGPVTSAWYQKKCPVVLCVVNLLFLTVLELFVHINRANSVTPYRGSTGIKCSEQLFFNNAF